MLGLQPSTRNILPSLNAKKQSGKRRLSSNGPRTVLSVSKSSGTLPTFRSNGSILRQTSRIKTSPARPVCLASIPIFEESTRHFTEDDFGQYECSQVSARQKTRTNGSTIS